MKEKIILNRIQCDYCNEIITSYNTHDFKYCKCNKTAVDGGLEYLKRVGDKYTELSLYDKDDFEILRENIIRGGRGINGDEPLKYVLLKDLNDNWLNNLINYEEKLRPNNIYLPFYKKELEYRLKNNIQIDENK